MFLALIGNQPWDGAVLHQDEVSSHTANDTSGTEKSVTSSVAPWALDGALTNAHAHGPIVSEIGVTTWTREEFGRRVQPLIPRLYRVCLALCRDPSTSEDILQNALVRAYAKRSSYAGHGTLLAWLYGIVRNEHQEYVRTQARRRVIWQNAIQGVAVWMEDLVAKSEPDPESWCVAKISAKELWNAIGEIREPYRTVVWMCDIEEMSYEEVASVLGIALGTVKSRHARGRKWLRQALELDSQANEEGGAI